jgi:hypothetical protein
MSAGKLTAPPQFCYSAGIALGGSKQGRAGNREYASSYPKIHPRLRAEQLDGFVSGAVKVPRQIGAEPFIMAA